MSKHRRVLWGEGLFLRPQHFQSQDAYHDARLRGARADLHPHYWGLRALEVDEDALGHGVLRVSRLAGVFPDGEDYEAPGPDSLPGALELDCFPDQSESMLVYAALPRLRLQASNLADAPAAGPPVSRYRGIDVRSVDCLSDAEPADIQYLEKQCLLLSELVPRGEFDCLPIARVKRAAAGGFLLDPDFLPPLLHVAASPRLLRALRQVLDALQVKADALQGQQRFSEAGSTDFRARDAAAYWLLHTVNTSFARLTHLLAHPDLPPERLFQGLLETAAGLMAFSSSQSLRDLPVYDHGQPEAAIRTVMSMIRASLGAVISDRHIGIPLAERAPGFHNGRLESDAIDEKTAFYLSVSAPMPAADLVAAVPQRFKVGAPDDVQACVMSALPAVPLAYLPKAPTAIPVRPGHFYFELERSGPLFDRMIKSRSVTIYVPKAVNDVEMELLAVTA
jgi:type VI secretion system protein ImpJ